MQKSNITVKVTKCPLSKYNLNYDRDIFNEIQNDSKELTKYIPKLNVDKEIVSIEFTKYLIFNFDGLLANIFRGFDNYGFHRRYFSIPEKLTFINYILIYTDIIQEQYFGDSLTPNLRTITVKSSTKGDIAKIYENPHYVPILKTRIDTINIQLRDIYGNPIQFTDFFSYVIIKLHFRKIQ